MENQQVFQREIEQRIDDYRRRYFSPSKATIKRWKADVKRELNNKNQLTLPLVFENQD